ncbi:Arc family DNA-binding protein [Acetobacter fabarum]|uniref:Arc family DNA-binding protein n=1 Tax=Acetobacter fabarum TaxID=483199 RepID=UPI0039EBD127
MSRSYLQVRFRPPPELHEKIIQSAKNERRSINSEIVKILECHFEEKEKASGQSPNRPDASHAE